MLDRSLIQAFVDARRRLPADAWARVVERLYQADAGPGADEAGVFVADIANRDVAWVLGRLLSENRGCGWKVLAAAMDAVGGMAVTESRALEIVWSGPANGVFPVRRFDQVLYDLILGAQSRILIVTFAAHRVEHLCGHLATALDRGADLTLVLEGAEESAGQLSYDAVRAFQSIAHRSFAVYCWPLERRERNAAGRPGKLHAKCAVVDGIALVGSGNLTDDAFNRNMELGLIVRDGTAADAIYAHFMALTECGELLRTPARG